MKNCLLPLQGVTPIFAALLDVGSSNDSSQFCAARAAGSMMPPPAVAIDAYVTLASEAAISCCALSTLLVISESEHVSSAAVTA